ncbi:hypothetical protein TIFTF001_003847 [Ficus carica]|uniref:Uncharacterized protein n=1 Tax=Ficus carica TaxID=3494 RepID=A0AA88DBG0_FICCA|nr:hypothetical protein TIFTF001_003847 [Ficus carica]
MRAHLRFGPSDQRGEGQISSSAPLALACASKAACWPTQGMSYPVRAPTNASPPHVPLFPPASRLHLSPWGSRLLRVRCSSR